MCGIVGYLTRSRDQEINLETNLHSIRHRGPDGKGVFEETFPNMKVGLGHVRLSIIDLSKDANQPFISECGNYIIIYNGEIYNYKPLKECLLRDGIKFRTTSDTEVLLNAYIRYGADLFDQLQGMYAFCILDKKEKQLILARDHLGIKPLYFTKTARGYYFASELKGLFAFQDAQKTIDYDQIGEFMLNGFVYEPETGFKNVYKIKPGNFQTVRIQNDTIEVRDIQYWTPVSASSNLDSVPLNSLIENSINMHLVSDVPVGLFFSGGVDSSLILSRLEKEITSFTVRSHEGSYEEAGMENDYYYAKKIADYLGEETKDINFDSTIDTSEQFLAKVEDVSEKSEELIADFTFTSSELLAKEASKQGFKVMLSGMGADEIFGGYPRYNFIQNEQFYRPMGGFVNFFLNNSKYFSKKIERFNTYFEETDFTLKYAALVGYYSKDEIRNLLKFDANIDRFIVKLKELLKGTGKKSKFKRAQLLDLYGFLSHNFLVADKSSMLSGLELRVPLATKQLFEKTFDLPDHKLLTFLTYKKPLRNMLADTLPKRYFNRKKTGFNPPLDGLINLLNKDVYQYFFQKNNFFEFVDKEIVSNVINEHRTEARNNTFKIYQLLYLSSWLYKNS